VESGGRPRPTEVHFLVMLKDLASPPPPADLVQLALQVRIQSEEAALGAASASEKSGQYGDAQSHPYSEYVYPWIKQKTEEADGKRRLGEDLLFASKPETWDEARSKLQEARSLYGETAKDARVVREALQLRDELMAALPYYSQWLARREKT